MLHTLPLAFPSPTLAGEAVALGSPYSADCGLASHPSDCAESLSLGELGSLGHEGGHMDAGLLLGEVDSEALAVATPLRLEDDLHERDLEAHRLQDLFSEGLEGDTLFAW